MYKQSQYIFKVLIIGEPKTGKTGLVTRYTESYFSVTHPIRVSRDYSLKFIKYDDDSVIRLEIFDMTNYDQQAGRMSRMFYRDAVGCFIVFDVTRGSTLEGVTKWKTDLDDKVQLPNGRPIPCVLLANKCDFPKEGLVTNAQQMDEFCREKDFIKWFETSGKENINVEKAFQFLLDHIMKLPDNLRSMRYKNTITNETINLTNGSVSNSNDSRHCYSGSCTN